MSRNNSPTRGEQQAQQAVTTNQQPFPLPSPRSSESFYGFLPTIDSELRCTIRQRDQVKRKLIRKHQQLQTMQPLGLAWLKKMESDIAVLYKEYSDFHSKVLALLPDDRLEEQENEYTAFEEVYDDVTVAVQEMLLEQSAARSPSATGPASQVVIQQQPLKIPIPTFDGSYAAWPKFKTIFQDLMANSGDSDAVKLYHLDKALVGQAAGILDARILTEGNYQQAWNVLTERYENKRAIIETHLRGLFSLKKMTSACHRELRALVEEASNHVESLRHLQQDVTGTAGHIYVYFIVSALDGSTRRAWEASQKKGEQPEYDQTMSFLKAQCRILENCESAEPVVGPSAKKKQTSPQRKTTLPNSRPFSVNTSQLEMMCDICSGAHRNIQCSNLNNLSTVQRIAKVRAADLCFNCLRKGHRSRECPSDKSCRKCQRRHHTLLHDNATSSRRVDANTAFAAEEMTAQPTSSTGPSQSSTVGRQPATIGSSVSTTCASNIAQRSKTVLLLTAVVHAFDWRNEPHPCRVLLDSGSQVNFVSEEMVNRLGLPRIRTDVPITGINDLRSIIRDKVQIKFQSRVSSFAASIECLVTPRVTGNIPTTEINIIDWCISNRVELADPAFFSPRQVDMLIGAEIFFDILKSGEMSIGTNQPKLRDSQLGWIVTGVAFDPLETDVALQHANHASLQSIEEKMQQFWKLEEVPQVSARSPEEQSCEEHFLSTYKRDDDGRFIVKLPFRETVSQLESCRSLALKRFLMLEKGLVRNPDLRSKYIEFIREYEALGHCREVNEADDPPEQQSFYLPHHAVLRPLSTSTKCRVVFDASAKSDPSQLSLNDVLQVGPVVQNDLHSIFLRFRHHRIAFTADIAKMYRQILHAPDDRRYLRIFWRSDPSFPLRVLELCTVTYGTACAPYLATRCLVRLVEEEGEHFPIAAGIVKDETYMDDILSGAKTVEEAIEAQRQLQCLLQRGGFPIHKWCSNSDGFLEHIPVEYREKKMPFTERGINQAIKVLGLLWDPSADQLYIANSPQPSPNKRITKRMIYSEIAKFFDPLGLVSPVIVTAKLLGQRLWQQKTDWDDPVSDELAQQWESLQESLSLLHTISVPRCVTFEHASQLELHGFADASTVAYGACVYLRSVFPDGTANLRLLTSKSKLAPLREMTIPRKELCAALLLARLVQRVVLATQMKIQKIVLWSDSTIVLAWLKKPLHQLEVFVRNRVATILECTKESRWEYIRSQENPADIVSRGQSAKVLRNNRLWWNGPSFLENGEYEIESTEAIPDESLPEIRMVVATPAVRVEPFLFFSKFSSFRRIQRVMGWMQRFIGNCRVKRENIDQREIHPKLTIAELRRSSEAILRVIQLVHLEDEIRRVDAGKPSKRLANLRPILRDGLLRVGGRLDRSLLPFEGRHPIILPDKDPVVRLLIRQMHEDNLHLGQSSLMNAMRQRYWLLNARSTIRQVTRKCVRCFRTNPRCVEQLMGNLPVSRVVPSPPFAVTGIDYAGPIWVRQGTRRPALVKAYVAVYVCMATKAVHLEAVSDLSTDAFLASLKRFIGRRGIVQQLHSDNATNFRGAHHELHELYQRFREQSTVQAIEEFCKTKEIEWHFIPPDAPQFGGLWEAAVKSTKTYLKKSSDQQN